MFESAARPPCVCSRSVAGPASFSLCSREELRAVRAVGLDPTPGAVAKCREAGVEAYGETLEEHAARLQGRQSTFDLIVAFHCLEHVGDPKSLLRSMRGLSNRGTSMFVSTPYSPMSFERKWYDPLNHPPHHLTRWNERAYAGLASQIGLKVDLILPPASGPIRRALTATKLLAHGPNQGPRTAIFSVFAHPLAAAREFRHQSARHRINGLVAPDVILAHFRGPV